MPRNVPTPLAFYDNECWARVHAANPTSIVLVSWNEFAEQTAMEPADSSTAPPGCDQWVDRSGQPAPNIYWDTTVANLQKWRQAN